MDISVVIVNYNTRKVTIDCIDSIFAQTSGVEFEVILVDNASIDGSKEWFEKDDRITYIYSEKNLGFGRANNLGYVYSKGKYIFCLNSDTILLNNALLLFFSKMESLPAEVGCLGTLLLDRHRQVMHSYGQFPTLSSNIKWRLGKSCEWKDPKWMQAADTRFFEVGYVTGADLFIRRSVIEACGFFDPDFFLYFEETEMQWRFQDRGYKVYVYANPQIVHLEGGSAPKHTPVMKTLRGLLRTVNSERLYFKKTRSKLFYCIVVLPYTTADFLWLVGRTFWLGVAKHIRNIHIHIHEDID